MTGASLDWNHILLHRGPFLLRLPEKVPGLQAILTMEE